MANFKDVEKLGNKLSVKDPSPQKELSKENDVKEKINSNRDSRQSFEEIVKKNKMSFRKDINEIKISFQYIILLQWFPVNYRLMIPLIHNGTHKLVI